jgi:hypothetical protein
VLNVSLFPLLATAGATVGRKLVPVDPCQQTQQEPANTRKGINPGPSSRLIRVPGATPWGNQGINQRGEKATTYVASQRLLHLWGRGYSMGAARG